jgi:hypothetical protein
MQNLKKSEKSRGILAFAYNVETIDYVSIAQSTLKLASKNLNLPYTLITDKEFKNESLNSRLDINSGSFIQWRNAGRHHAYELSPYDETLVIDVDYLVLNNNLNKIFDTEWDYLLQRNSFALATEFPKLMGETSLPYIWATVFAFRKTAKSKMYFDMIGRIQRNYHYYRSLFNIQERIFRNDFAFAISDILLNGYNISKYSIPENMLTVDQVIHSIEVVDRNLIIKDSSKSYVVPRTNLHVMSKAYLQSDNFKKLVDRLLDES